jgi:hypothetical protein
MAFELHRQPLFPAVAASALSAGAAVGLVNGGDVQRQVIPLATCNIEPIGVARASAVNPGDAVSVYDHSNIVRAVAAASLGHGQLVGVASTNGGLGIVAGGSGSVGPVVWAVGRSLSAAAAGETFSLFINPRQISGV